MYKETVFGKGYTYGTARDFKPFQNKNFYDNIILAEGIFKDIKQGNETPYTYQRTNNDFVLGGTGSGKSRMYGIPNLLQLSCNQIVTDPKGLICDQLRDVIENDGQKVKVLNLSDFQNSCTYNPLAYIYDELGIMKLAHLLVQARGVNTKDPFWDNTAEILITAIIGLLFDLEGYLDRPRNTYIKRFNNRDVNLAAALELLDLAGAQEENDAYISPLDERFEAFKRIRPDSFSVRQYTKYKQAAGRTLRSIIITAQAALTPLSARSVQNVLKGNSVDFRALATEPTVLFIIPSDTDDTYSFLVNIAINQAIEVLINEANNLPDGRLPIHNRFMFDEFSNIGKIDSIERKISVIRSRNISMSIITQSLGQISELYSPEILEAIIGNTDQFLYLGTSNMYDRNYVQAKMKPVVDKDFYKIGSDDCIVFERGLLPIKAQKYRLENHPRYKETLEYKQKHLKRNRTKEDRAS